MSTSARARVAFAANPNDPRHGTLNGYTNLKCRCQPCRDANCTWQTRRRTERGEPPVHGVWLSYSNYNCRCDGCREAWNAYTRDNKRRRRALTA